MYILNKNEVYLKSFGVEITAIKLWNFLTLIENYDVSFWDDNDFSWRLMKIVGTTFA